MIHLGEELDSFRKHWKENGIIFDAILVGYLGSITAIEMAQQIISELLAPTGISIVDPAMADHGKLYSGFDEKYAHAMKALCASADIILPNVTEAAMFAGLPYREDLTEEYVYNLLKALRHPCVVLTGVGYQNGLTGAAIFNGKSLAHYHHPKLGKSFHGTGDMFAACFTGALMQEKTLMESVRIAADFVCRAITNTCSAPAHWYGVRFETALPELIRMLQE